MNEKNKNPIDEAKMNELIENIRDLAERGLLNIGGLNDLVTSLTGQKREIAFAGKELIFYGLRELQFNPKCDLGLSEEDFSSLNFLFNMLKEIEPLND